MPSPSSATSSRNTLRRDKKRRRYPWLPFINKKPNGRAIMKGRNLPIAVTAFAVSLLGVGCARKLPPAAQQSPPPFQRDEQSLAGMVRQERTKIENDFKNLAIYYRLC